MKKHLILVLIGAMSLLAACGEKEGGEGTEELDTTADIQVLDSDGLKIAFYNQDSLRIYYDYYRERDSIMTQKGMIFQNVLQSKSAELQSYIMRSEERARGGLLSENEMIQIQQTIQQREAELMNYQQTEGVKLESETMNEMDAIGAKIQKFAQQYSEENGIDLLLIHATGGQIGYITPAMDVTIPFTEYLNQETEKLLSDDVQ
ncbi:MAG: OmpH family outer membrane protein [Crocinitomicaceae bacterium]|nr:OmpH family outer membrane protein [Crocinitomicaceae bacterium]